MAGIVVVTHGDHRRVAQELGLDRERVVHTTEDWTIDSIERGMTSGATSLMVIVAADVAGKRCHLILETSLAVFMQAAAALAATHAAEVEKPGYVVMSPAARDLIAPRYAEAIRRAIPSATFEQAAEAAQMMLDGIGADAPPEARL
jgi:hypothetical protein